MKIRKAELEVIAGRKDQYPPADLPELALVGRSNVGKSSFINSLGGRKKLAYTSSKPGKTRTVNFYNINDDFRLVDLPGYGFARVSKAEKDNWAKIINEYLLERENLYEVIQIVDIRHDPTQDDREMYAWILESGFTGYVIATKGDKISRGRYINKVGKIKKVLGVPRTDLIIPYSAIKGDGREDAFKMIEKTIKKEEP